MGVDRNVPYETYESPDWKYIIPVQTKMGVFIWLVRYSNEWVQILADAWQFGSTLRLCWKGTDEEPGARYEYLKILLI